VQASSAWSVVALRILVLHLVAFFLFFWKGWLFVLHSHTVQTLSSRRMIALRGDSTVLNITGFDSRMHNLFFRIFRIDLEDGSISKIGDISDLGAFSNGDRFPILPGNHNILNRDTNFLSHLDINSRTCSRSSP